MIISISGPRGSGKDTVGLIIKALTCLHRLDSNEHLTDEDIVEIVDKGEIPYEYHETWEIQKFAMALKQIASILTGIPINSMEDPKVKDAELGEEWRYWFVKLPNACYPIDKETMRVSQIFNNEKDVKDSWFKGEEARNGFEIDSKIPTLRWLLQHLGTDAIRNHIHPNTWVNSLMAHYEDSLQPDSPAPIPEYYSKWIITDTRFPNELAAVKSRNGICVKIVRESVETGDTHESENAWRNWNFDYTIDNNGKIEDLIKRVKTFLSYYNIPYNETPTVQVP